MKVFNHFKIITILLALGVILFGCAAQQRVVPKESIDKTLQPIEIPDYLAENGEKMLATEKVDEAEQQFQKALSKDPNHLPSLIGMSRVETVRGNRKKAIAWAEKGVDQAETVEGRVMARTAEMEIHLTLQQGDWVDEMEALWEKNRKEYPQPEKATLLMGKAYTSANRDLEASVCFQQVIDWNGRYSGEADILLASLYRRLRAEPGTAAGREVAERDRISRVDFAVLIAEELKLPEYLAARESQKYNAGFTTPKQFAEQKEAESLPADINGHPYEMDIQEILAINIRGLEPLPDGLFHPGQALNRANFALVVEDVLMRVKDEPLLKTAFVGNESPFPDVVSDHYAFNAMVVCTTRNLLAANLDGAFRPNEDVTGAECLLAIRQLKEEIKRHQVTY